MSIKSQILSQNFIKNPLLIQKLLAKTSISQNDTVLDIGAGNGIITQELAKTCKNVIAIEIDPELTNQLKQKFVQTPNVEILPTDFLKYHLPKTPYKVFSNIPFSLTTEILNKLTNTFHPPIDAYLIMQKQAAERFMGINEGYLVSLVIKPFFSINKVYEFYRSDFIPEPSVDTVLLHIRRLKKPLIEPLDAVEYKNFISYILLQQKPTLKLRTKKIFTFTQFKKLSKDLGFLPDAVASQIYLDQWIGLFNYYKIGVSPEKKIR